MNLKITGQRVERLLIIESSIALTHAILPGLNA
jgi:hypothetical protein